MQFLTLVNNRVVKLNWEVNRPPSSHPAGPINHLPSNPSFPINLSTLLSIYVANELLTLHEISLSMVSTLLIFASYAYDIDC